MTHSFRFGIQLDSAAPGLTWADTVRRVEDLGWSSLMMPDHFEEQLAVAPALAVAAEVTSSLRLGALVFGNDYRHPVVLAKDMATLDVLSGGRMEFGLGAGWMRSDYEKAGLACDRPGLRIERMVESLAIIRSLFGDGPVDFDGDHYTITGLEGFPKPVQSPPPVVIGGGGKRMLGVAAREADIVAITANLRAGEIGADTISDVTGERFDEKLRWVRDAAGDRFDSIELSTLVFSTQLTTDRAEAPAVLIGTPNEMIETLQARRERWGFSYVVMQGHDTVEALAPVVAELSGT